MCLASGHAGRSETWRGAQPLPRERYSTRCATWRRAQRATPYAAAQCRAAQLIEQRNLAPLAGAGQKRFCQRSGNTLEGRARDRRKGSSKRPPVATQCLRMALGLAQPLTRQCPLPYAFCVPALVLQAYCY